MSRSVETQGATVDEAVSAALADLGVSADEADVEVLQEAKRGGLFGGSRPAQVRVTVKGDGSARAEREEEAVAGGAGRGQEQAGGGEESVAPDQTATIAQDGEEVIVEAETAEREVGDFETASPEEQLDMLDQEADLAADFVEGLLDLLDLPGDIEIEVQEEQAFLNIEDVGSGLLIGRRGATLDALQELVRGAVQRQTTRRSHVRVDVEGYRSRQIEKLRDKCREAIAQVRESGEAVRLEPMDAYERKMMHDLVAKAGGVTSSSEGTEPRRRVVIHPAGEE